MQAPTKYCPMCDKTKPLAEFHKHVGTKDGVQVYCAPCQNQQTKDYALKAKADGRIQTARKRAAANREAAKATPMLALNPAPAPAPPADPVTNGSMFGHSDTEIWIDAVKYVTMSIAKEYINDPTFDRERFLKACGVRT